LLKTWTKRRPQLPGYLVISKNEDASTPLMVLFAGEWEDAARLVGKLEVAPGNHKQVEVGFLEHRRSTDSRCQLFVSLQNDD
jgi:hypothetical protein